MTVYGKNNTWQYMPRELRDYYISRKLYVVCRANHPKKDNLVDQLWWLYWSVLLFVLISFGDCIWTTSAQWIIAYLFTVEVLILLSVDRFLFWSRERPLFKWNGLGVLMTVTVFVYIWSYFWNPLKDYSWCCFCYVFLSSNRCSRNSHNIIFILFWFWL